VLPPWTFAHFAVSTSSVVKDRWLIAERQPKGGCVGRIFKVLQLRWFGRPYRSSNSSYWKYDRLNRKSDYTKLLGNCWDEGLIFDYCLHYELERQKGLNIHVALSWYLLNASLPPQPESTKKLSSTKNLYVAGGMTCLYTTVEVLNSSHSVIGISRKFFSEMSILFS
jgi:hypothetical protein